jgi:hypothetical protein
MCNDHEQHVRWPEYRKVMQALDLTIPSHQSEFDLPRADDIRINDTGPVVRGAGDKVELVRMTFAFPPARPGGAPVFNFRSEGRQFANSNRSSSLRPRSLNSPARSTQRPGTGSP